jgi:hypothetical protein
MQQFVEFLRHRVHIHLIHAAKWGQRLIKRKDFVKGQIAIAHGLTKRERDGRDFFPERGKLAIEENFSMCIPSLGVLEREAAEQVHESVGVQAKAIGFAGKAIEADERLLVVLRGDGLLDVIGLLEAPGEVERKGNPEEFVRGKKALLIKQGVCGYGSTDESSKAVENENSR